MPMTSSTWLCQKPRCLWVSSRHRPTWTWNSRDDGTAPETHCSSFIKGLPAPAVRRVSWGRGLGSGAPPKSQSGGRPGGIPPYQRNLSVAAALHPEWVGFWLWHFFEFSCISQVPSFASAPSVSADGGTLYTFFFLTDGDDGAKPCTHLHTGRERSSCTRPDRQDLREALSLSNGQLARC